MFAVVARPVQRRALAHSARWMSQKPPSSSSGPTPSSELKPKTPETSSEPTTSPLPDSLPSLDFSPEATPKQQAQERTGARSSKGTMSASEKKRQNMGKLSFGLLGLSLGLGIFYMGREWEEDELQAKKLVSNHFNLFYGSAYNIFRSWSTLLKAGGTELKSVWATSLT